MQLVEQLFGDRLLRLDVGQIGHQVHGDVPLAAQLVGVVVHPRLGRLLRRHLVPDLCRPDQPVRLGFIGRRLHPARHDKLGNAPAAAFLVARLGAFLQVLQQLVGVPVARVVILHIPRLFEADRHEPLHGLAHDHPHETFIGLIAHGVHQARRLRRRNVGKTGRQGQPGLTTQGHLARALLLGGTGRLGSGRHLGIRSGRGPLGTHGKHGEQTQCNKRCTQTANRHG